MQNNELHAPIFRSRNAVRRILGLSLAFLLVLFLKACESEEGGPAAGSSGPDAILARIAGAGKRAIDGPAPESSSLGDLKINKPVIYLTKAVKNRILVLNKTGVPITGAYLSLPGAASHLDIDASPDESADSIAVFYLEIDTDGLELPFSEELTFAPHDDQGNVIDVFPTPVEADDPGESTCSPTEPGDFWFWIYTLAGGQLNQAPGYGFISDYTTMGCCVEGESVDCLGLPPNRTLNVDNQYYIIWDEYIRFFPNGDYAGEIREHINDFDPANSDYCNNRAAYRLRKNYTAYLGQYTHNASTGKVEITTQDYQGDGFPFIQPGKDYEIVGCHFLVERMGEGPESVMRVFERRNLGDTGWVWYD